MPMLFATLAEVKEQVKTVDNDGLLNALITRMSAFIEKQCNRAFEIAEYDERHDGEANNGGRLCLRQFPIVTVHALYDDTSRAFTPATIIPPSSYVWYADEGVVRLDIGESFQVGLQNVRVTYQAGYATPPADLVQATIDLIAFKFKLLESGNGALKSKSLADASFTYNNGVAVPQSVQTVIDGYVKRQLFVL